MRLIPICVLQNLLLFFLDISFLQGKVPELDSLMFSASHLRASRFRNVTVQLNTHRTIQNLQIVGNMSLQGVLDLPTPSFPACINTSNFIVKRLNKFISCD
jgi:hypothetical protein